MSPMEFIRKANYEGGCVEGFRLGLKPILVDDVDPDFKEFLMGCYAEYLDLQDALSQLNEHVRKFYPKEKELSL